MLVVGTCNFQDDFKVMYKWERLGIEIGLTQSKEQ